MADSIQQLKDEHLSLLSDFCSVEGDCDDYFKKYLFLQAWRDQQDGFANVCLFVREDEFGNKKILGFYAVRCSSLIIDNTDNGERIGEPAIELLELAVHKDYRKQGIGSKLIKDVFNKAMTLNESYIGVRHLIVCAKATAVSFYEKFGIKKLTGDKKIPRNIDNQECIGMSVRVAYQKNNTDC